MRGPYAAVAAFTEGVDNLDTQFWTLLLGTSSTRIVDALDERLFGDGVSHGAETRAWAELAFWFPGRSAPAGAQAVAAFGPRNIPMDDVGGGDPPALSGTPSHSYLWVRRLDQVWLGYQRLKQVFKGSP